jgi:hypothetical protein
MLWAEAVESKPTMALHFYNGGQSTARHFTVYVVAEIPNAGMPIIRHRHRYRISDGTILTEGETNFGLAAQSEYVEYLTDPSLLWTYAQLRDFNSNNELAIGGDMEYCDEFGAYHCQGWGAEYKPMLREFVAGGPIAMPCVREDGDAASIQRTFRNAEPNVTVKEIEPCEQPGEPEYLRETYRESSPPSPVSHRSGNPSSLSLETRSTRTCPLMKNSAT